MANCALRAHCWGRDIHVHSQTFRLEFTFILTSSIISWFFVSLAEMTLAAPIISRYELIGSTIIWWNIFLLSRFLAANNFDFHNPNFAVDDCEQMIRKDDVDGINHWYVNICMVNSPAKRGSCNIQRFMCTPDCCKCDGTSTQFNWIHFAASCWCSHSDGSMACEGSTSDEWKPLDDCFLI